MNKIVELKFLQMRHNESSTWKKKDSNKQNYVKTGIETIVKINMIRK